MKLHEIISGTMPRFRLQEGGSMPGVGAIHRDEIAPTLKPLEKKLGMDLMNNALGSVGKREFSGDIDVAVNIESDQMGEFLARLEKLPEILDIARSSVIMTKVKIQNYDQNKQTDRPRTGFVQVDFMPGDPDWLKTYYHSPDEKSSKYKGVYRNIMLSTMASLLDREDSPQTTPDGRPLESNRYLWSSSLGLVRVRREPVPKKNGQGYTKQNKNNVIAGPWKKPDEIADALKLDGPADLDSFETLLAAARKNYPGELVTAIMNGMKNSPVIQDQGIPGEIE